REPSGREREEVSRNRLGGREADADAIAALGALELGPVGYGLPRRRNRQLQREPRFQVRLIETGKRFVCPRRNEDRVEEIRIAVERRVAGTERQLEDVLACADAVRRDDDVPVPGLEGNRTAVARD